MIQVVDMQWTILGWGMAGLLGFCVGILVERYLVKGNKFKLPLE